MTWHDTSQFISYPNVAKQSPPGSSDPNIPMTITKKIPVTFDLEKVTSCSVHTDITTGQVISSECDVTIIGGGFFHIDESYSSFKLLLPAAPVCCI